MNRTNARGIQWGMDLISPIRELCSRALSQKIILICLFALTLCSTVCAIIFLKTPAFFDYHLKICDRFLDRVCYSDRSVVVICFERTAGCAFYLLLILLGGLHPAALVLPSCALVFRAYNFGGMLAILFSVYKFSGAIVAFTLYLPIHLLLDVLLFAAASISFSRAFCFRFCTSDFKELLLDFLLFLLLVFAVCVVEAILLGVFFHPLGNLV